MNLLRHRSAQLLSVDSTTIQPQRSRRPPFNSSSASPYDKTFHLRIDIPKPSSVLPFLSRLDRLPPTLFLLAPTRLPERRQPKRPRRSGSNRCQVVQPPGLKGEAEAQAKDKIKSRPASSSSLKRPHESEDGRKDSKRQ